MIRLLFLSLFLIGEVSGDCNCSYLDQTYSQSWPNFWLQNAFDGNNACETTNCTYWLDGGAGEGVGLYTRIQWDSTTNGYINIYNSDATRGKGTVIKLGIDNTFESTPEASQGRYVLVDMVLTSPGNVLCTMGITTPVAPTATTAPPPPTTTTPPYNGTLSKNPALISNDLLIMVDQGQTNDINDFPSTRQFAAGVVNTIAPSVFGGVATVDSPVTGTRLSLNYLNYVNYGPAITPWTDNSSDIADQILNLRPLQTKKTDFYKALNSLVDSSSVFNPANDDDADMNSRNTAQRVLLIVASSPPDQNDTIYTKQIAFDTYDIHPIFVAYNFDTTVEPFVKLGSLGFTIEAVNNISEETINGFVEKYFLKNICNAPNTTKFSVDTDPSKNVIKYGFTTFSNSPNSTYTPNYAKNRYCNFQQISYYVARPTPPTPPSTTTGRYCFKVFYELEVEKDSLKFYQCNSGADSDCKDPAKYIEYVTLSGTDVDGSTFCFTNSTRIDFATDESGVYGGYYISFYLEQVAT